LFRAGSADDQPRMTIPTEPGRAAAHQARRFLEHARVDPRRANIVIQLAEAVGDRIDSLSSYIDMLLVLDSSLLRFTALEDGPAADAARAHDKYVGWFAALGMLERRL
jgi:hypothetical protein